MVLNRRGGIHYIDGLVQERRNSIANALELRLFCTKAIDMKQTWHSSRMQKAWRYLSIIVPSVVWSSMWYYGKYLHFFLKIPDNHDRYVFTEVVCLNVVRIAVILSRTGELKHHTCQDDSEEGVENISTNILQDAGDRGFSLFAMNLKIITLTGMIYNHGSSKGIQDWLGLHAEKLNSLIEFYRKFVCTLYTAVVPKSTLFS